MVCCTEEGGRECEALCGIQKPRAVLSEETAQGHNLLSVWKNNLTMESQVPQATKVGKLARGSLSSVSFQRIQQIKERLGVVSTEVSSYPGCGKNTQIGLPTLQGHLSQSDGVCGHQWCVVEPLHRGPRPNRSWA